MIEVLLLSDKDVQNRLFARVEDQPGIVLVAGISEGREVSFEEREPFASLEDIAPEHLLQLLVVDDGNAAGMWRDPLGELSRQLFPDERSRAYAAANGYLLLAGGQVAGVLKKTGSPKDDAWFLQQALSRIHQGIPPPDPSRRPGGRTPADGVRAVRSYAELKQRVLSVDTDPWALLGIPRGCTLGEARRAFRLLLAQYHPDKVAHLGPEFRELAEIKTRQIMGAWDTVQRVLGGG